MKVSIRGLGTGGLLIIVFAVGLIGAFIWADHIRQSSTENVAEQNFEIEPTDETTNWKTETVDGYGISYKYPSGDGWKPTFGVVDSQLPGHEAIIGVNYTQCGPNCGFALSVGVFDKEFEAGTQKNFGESQMENNDHYSLTLKQTVTLDGISGTRWQYAPRDNDNATIVYYYFPTNNFSYTFTVNNNGAKPEDVDLTSIGEKIVGTVQFTD